MLDGENNSGEVEIKVEILGLKLKFWNKVEIQFCDKLQCRKLSGITLCVDFILDIFT